MSLISGLYTSLSGMNAQRQVLDITAHNIANEATPGYHRQRAELSPAGVSTVAAVFAGNAQQTGGVDVVQITRIVDQLAEDRLVRESAMQAGAQTLSTTLDRLEAAFPEPSDNGIAAMFDGFWAGWSDVSSLPGDVATRNQTLERAETLVDGLQRAAADIDQIEATTRESVISIASDINDLTDRIAQLNKAIVGSANAANDLTDQRDIVMRQLAELTGAVARPADGGQIDVSIGGRTLVSGTISQHVEGTGGVLTWETDGSAVVAPASQAASLARTLSDLVPRYRTALDDIASSLVTDVNALHTVGYDQNGATGWNFFDPAGVTASSIAISADVLGQPERLAAGAPVFPGPVAPGAFDGEQARVMSALADLAGGPSSSYRSMVTGLGVEVRSATRRLDIQEDVTQAAYAQAASVGGVSIDEEMATLVASQRAYQASARVLTTVDQLLGTLIERTGVVGR